MTRSLDCDCNCDYLPIYEVGQEVLISKVNHYGAVTRHNADFLTAVLFQCILRWWLGRMSGDLFTSCRANFTAGITPGPTADPGRPGVVGKKPAM